MARHFNAWRGWFNAHDIVTLRSEQQIVSQTLNDLAEGEMNMGKAYRRLAAQRRIALLEEFIHLKRVAPDWPEVDEVLGHEHPSAD